MCYLANALERQIPFNNQIDNVYSKFIKFSDNNKLEI